MKRYQTEKTGLFAIVTLMKAKSYLREYPIRNAFLNSDQPRDLMLTTKGKGKEKKDNTITSSPAKPAPSQMPRTNF
jgi:hypothetical protein